MNTETFLKTYAENLLRAMREGRISFSYLTIECDFCPLRELCEKEYAEGSDKFLSCTELFRLKLSDGYEY